MTIEQMVAQIGEARVAFIDYMTTTYKEEMNPWSEGEMYEIVGFLDCSCERIKRLDTLLKTNKYKGS